VTILVIIGSKIMKKIISILSIAIFFGCLLFRCNSDLKQDAPTPIAVSVTPEKLGQDADFIRITDLTSAIAQTVKGHVYSLKTFENIDVETKRLNELLGDGKLETEAEEREVLEKLGFQNPQSLIIMESEITQRIGKLKKKYSNFNVIINQEKSLKIAFSSADKQIELSRNILKTEVIECCCIECPLNNCDRCTNPGVTAPIDSPNPGGGDPCNKECKRLLLAVRSSDYASAMFELRAELLICLGLGGAAAAEGAAGGGVALGPVGAGAGAVIWGGGTLSVCSYAAVTRYRLQIANSDANYQFNLFTNCNCTH
jgi:hypothetical protein